MAISSSSIHQHNDSRNNYYTTEHIKEAVIDGVSKGKPKQWVFLFTQILNIREVSLPIEKVKLYSPTFIQTSAKISNLQGNTLIISDSQNIGNVRASTVVLYNSKVHSVAADHIFIFNSYVEGDVIAKKGLTINSIIPRSGVESSVSCTLDPDTKFNFVRNEQGSFDLLVKEGSVESPKFTAEGHPRQGTVILSDSAELKKPNGCKVTHLA